MTFNNSSITLSIEHKPLQALWRAICYLPWVWLILLALFTLGTTFQVGHLPYYGNPDPKDTGTLVLLYFPIIIGIPTLFASIPIWSIVGVIIERTTTYRFRWQNVLLYIVGMFMCAWVAFSDVAGLLTWLAD